ncbi:Uncharacterized protein BP5553_07699 [Venustampulla echinocandica]|uniref:Alternative oxidase n=1 Tax=Venustampulla echinocandica TaxID=2656787 RepID=A0A370TH92_9HELO|nr:Uncharacterized protein BP5553_07699 [Venustampulla echinocandica]RDL34571.1 Uncharacterized protein BP5553_07699 [Venustampulla echinocandica]
MGVQLSPKVNRRYSVLASVILGAIWIWATFDPSYQLPNRISNRPLFGQVPEVAVDIFDFPALDSESIKSICGATQWNESVVFTCNESVGGIGNIKNSILNCVRYAISAGASLVIPSIVLRDTMDITQIRTGVKTDMSFMFDTQHFLDSIRLSCPSLKIHSSIEDIKDFHNPRDAISLLPESLVDNVPATGLPEPAAWRGQFYTWLEQFSTPEVPGPMVIDLGRSYLTYPIYSDGEAFALSFGSILKPRSDVRVLATKTLQSLAETYSLNLDLSQDILPKAFFGAHLRTEKDAVEGWPAPDWVYSRHETQSKAYLEQAPRSNSSIVYVASGDLNEVARFAVDASKASDAFTVTTKFDLLKGRDLEELQALKWDQQSLVDFLVMLKASDFAGIGHSSFAWNVALKRHVFAESKRHLDGPQMMSDELSQIYGEVRGYPEYAACLWP